ncbi:M28 family peptidase [Myxococcus sp. CA040A]|uniref:M28 family peptidase n=1 Tax=Myxococcus sp. CA040A TaxID=2741738 RepID=UPI00157AEDDF|nr:M28 family peptidase [Myxococcus sp. CA040A]NTX01043.1 M28 family peptidase [Myxococcus sp. CA040A]
MWIRERAVEEATPLPHGATQSDEVRLRQWVEHLAVPRHLFANARNNAWVRDELGAAFERYGLSVRIQGRYRNVVALPRHAKGRPVTFVAAHYDSVPDCPGADDNASGLAVMLECARVLAQSDAGPHVGFIGFNAEEDGLLGSRDFVAHGLPALPCQLGMAHVLEMVGFRKRSGPVQALPFPWVPQSLRAPDFLGLVGKGRSNAIMDRAINSTESPGLRLLTAKTWGPLHVLLPDLMRSDHFPFWTAGKPAVLWTDTGNFRNPHYHCSTDTPDTLDYGFMREVSVLLNAVVSRGVV